MRFTEVIERSRANDDRKFELPVAPKAHGHRQAFQANRLALEDVVWTLNHLCPPTTRQGLTVLLSDLAKCEAEIQSRDSLIRLAAWAIKGASQLDDRRRARAQDVC